jgi:hypothetical protein
VNLTDGHLRRVPALPLTPPHGDAWLYSTLDDLHRWSVLMDGSDLVPAAEVTEAFSAGAGGYGLGWFVDQGFGRRRHRHNGFLPGYATDFIRFPGDSLTIILFSNLDRARMSRIARDLSAIVLGQPYDMPVRGRLAARPDAGQAARLEGTYLLAQGVTLRVRNETDYLTAQVRGRFTAGLIPLSSVEFYMPSPMAASRSRCKAMRPRRRSTCATAARTTSARGSRRAEALPTRRRSGRE